MNERLPMRTYLFFAAQSINLTTAVMSVAMAAIVGSMLAKTPSMATLPYGFQFLLVMLTTYPASWLMSKLGRKTGFMIGNLFLGLAGVLGFISIQTDAFYLLVAAHSSLGVYIAFANFNRFAAADGLSSHLKPKAISLVVAGGVIAAFTGPFLSETLKEIVGYHDFAMSYAFFIILALASMIITLSTPSIKKKNSIIKNIDSSPLNIIKNKSIILAITLSALGYGIMNLLMVQASLHMESMHTEFSHMNMAIQWHVFAMFAPSFLTGALIRHYSINNILFAGLILLMMSAGSNIFNQDYLSTSIGLILLGLGWNFTYVGGGALLAEKIGNNPNSMKIQGINDFSISIMATIGAFLPSFLQNSIGWKNTNILILTLCCVFLVITFNILSTNRLNNSAVKGKNV